MNTSVDNHYKSYTYWLIHSASRASAPHVMAVGAVYNDELNTSAPVGTPCLIRLVCSHLHYHMVAITWRVHCYCRRRRHRRCRRRQRRARLAPLILPKRCGNFTINSLKYYVCILLFQCKAYITIKVRFYINNPSPVHKIHSSTGCSGPILTY